MKQRRLAVASRNPNKIREIKELLGDLPFAAAGIEELGDFPIIEEDGETFRENARKKALETARLIGELVLADDSGLEVDALRGAPGVQSARFAGEPGDDRRNNELLLAKLEGLEPERRGAQFRCVMALAGPEGLIAFSEGVCRGRIICEPRGSLGFGYDPLFLVPEYGLTFAELGEEIKNKISHRFLAMEDMLKILKEIAGR